MNIFSLLLHAGSLIHAGEDVEAIVQELVQHKESFPSKAEWVKLIDDAAALVASGVIGLPDDVVKKLGDALAGLKAEL